VRAAAGEACGGIREELADRKPLAVSLSPSPFHLVMSSRVADVSSLTKLS